MQRTLVIVKPDGVQRMLTGKILTRFEERGFKVIAMKLVQVDRELAEKHYEVHKGKFFYEGLVSYIISSPVVVMVLEGHEAISAVRKMVGATRPWEAEAGTIRGDYALMDCATSSMRRMRPKRRKRKLRSGSSRKRFIPTRAKSIAG